MDGQWKIKKNEMKSTAKKCIHILDTRLHSYNPIEICTCSTQSPCVTTIRLRHLCAHTFIHIMPTFSPLLSIKITTTKCLRHWNVVPEIVHRDMENIRRHLCGGVCHYRFITHISIGNVWALIAVLMYIHTRIYTNQFRLWFGFIIAPAVNLGTNVKL